MEYLLLEVAASQRFIFKFLCHEIYIYKGKLPVQSGPLMLKEISFIFPTSSLRKSTTLCLIYIFSLYFGLLAERLRERSVFWIFIFIFSFLNSLSKTMSLNHKLNVKSNQTFKNKTQELNPNTIFSFFFQKKINYHFKTQSKCSVDL